MAQKTQLKKQGRFLRFVSNVLKPRFFVRTCLVAGALLLSACSRDTDILTPADRPTSTQPTKQPVSIAGPCTEKRDPYSPSIVLGSHKIKKLIGDASTGNRGFDGPIATNEIG